MNSVVSKLLTQSKKQTINILITLISITINYILNVFSNLTCYLVPLRLQFIRFFHSEYQFFR